MARTATRWKSVLLLLLLALLAITWVREPYVRPPRDPRVRVIALPPPPPGIVARYLGPFRIEGTWQLVSHDPRFFGYSALVPQPDGRLLAVNDGGATVLFPPPGSGRHRMAMRRIHFAGGERDKSVQDTESAVRDPGSGRYWMALEGENAILRLDRRLREEARVYPPAMRGWGINSGAEALTRLADGRFVAIREVTRLLDTRLHEALVFDGDPVGRAVVARPFLFDGPDNFSVVDMALLPDGRALVLMRRLVWPVPARFAGRIVIVDPAAIRPGAVLRSVTLARLASTLPVDNFEAIAVSGGSGDGSAGGSGGRITVWLMSDDNHMRLMQRTLLWKLSVDPRHLPRP